MELFYDFHIHSALSPCADADMTPCNIANMAALKGLHAISVCDHNSGANLKAAAAAAHEAGVLFLPGMELTTAEEVHLLAYFEDLDAACALGDIVYAALPDIPNNEAYFGIQLVMDEKDEIKGNLEKLLLSALPFSLEECVRMIRQHGGAAVPAHINRGSNSILANLGFMPQTVQFSTIETLKNIDTSGVNLTPYQVLHSSDAHTLCDISEQVNFLIVKNHTIHNIFQAIVK